MDDVFELLKKTKQAIINADEYATDKMDILTRHEQLSMCLDELYHHYISTDNEKLKIRLKPVIEMLSSLEQKYGEKL